MARRNPFTVQNIFMILTIAIVGIYLFGLFTTTGAEGTEFLQPSQLELEAGLLWIFKIIIVMTAATIGFIWAMRISLSNLTRKQVFQIIIFGVIAYVVWDFVISAIWGASSFDEIAFSVVKKVGLLK